jgi:hypothetical protein
MRALSARRASPFRRLTVPAADDGRLVPELAAGIAREEREVESACARAIGSSCGGSALSVAPVRGGGAHRCALFGRIHAEGDGRRTARECAGRRNDAMDISNTRHFVRN